MGNPVWKTFIGRNCSFWLSLNYSPPSYTLQASFTLLITILPPANPPPPPWPPADPPDNSPAGVLHLLTNLLWLELTSLHRYLLHPGDDLILALHPALPTLDPPTQLARDPLTPGLWLGAPHCSALYVASVHWHQPAGGRVARTALNLLRPAHRVVLHHLHDLVHCGALGGETVKE